MNFKLHWVDLTEPLAQKIQPVVFIERPKVGGDRLCHASVFGSAKIGRTGEFWVPTGPINAEKIEWALTVQGDRVRIPITAYTTPQQANSLLVACATELGLRAGYDLCRRCHSKNISEVTLVIGNKCDKVENGFRFYAGMAYEN